MARGWIVLIVFGFLLVLAVIVIGQAGVVGR